MNIHEAAREILKGEELPKILTGICKVMRDFGCWRSYEELDLFMDSPSAYLPKPGTWTDQRLNIICLLAITEPEDFE